MARSARDLPPPPGDRLVSAAAPRWSRSFLLRVTAGLIALVPLVLLGLAGTLSPDADGLGTHQQLGLPPCSMRLIVGIRCPSCGMTTSWAHFMRGQWPESLRVNPGGFLLALFSVMFAGTSAVVAWNGELPGRSAQRRFAVALIIIAAVTVVHWVIRLAGEGGGGA